MPIKSKEKVPTGTDTNEWLEMSARVAWRLWLADRRTSYPADEAAEARIWKREATDYRAYVRAVLRSLQKEGILFNKM